MTMTINNDNRKNEGFNSLNITINKLTEILSLLKKIKKLLRIAARWGIVDILTGGFIFTFIKHLYLELAKDRAMEINNEIDDLNKIKSPLNEIKLVKIDFKKSLLIADFWIQGTIGFFVSLEVQSKIKNEIIGVNAKIIYLNENLKYLSKKLSELL